MTFFESIATPLIEVGWKVAPCYPHYATDANGRILGKTVDLSDPLNQRSSDPAQIHAWGEAKPHANVCVYAVQEPGGLCFVDKDGAQSLVDKYERETGKKFPKTLLVCSSVIDDGKGGKITKGHWYFQQTPKTMALPGNIGEDKTGGLFSFRVKNQYVASIGSIHPATQKPYEIYDHTPIIPIPDEFVDWLYSQVTTKEKPTAQAMQEAKLPKGSRYPALISYLGKLWSAGTPREAVIAAGLSWAEEHFELPEGAFNAALVQREIEHFLDHGYEQGQPTTTLKFSGQTAVASSPELEFDEKKFAKSSYPVFPDYVMAGTSLYENFVKPICEHNARVPYFMWMPAATIMLNYLGTKIKIKSQFMSKGINLSQYLVLIGTAGEAYKSESVNDAMEYFRYISCLNHDSGLKTAEGRSIVWTAGSIEGVGIDMQKTNCKNAILFYDELETLTKKAGIESSSLVSNLLTLYESKKFGNKVKTGKEAYSLEPNSYCFSLIACTTPEMFEDLWSAMNGAGTGLNDRFMFIMQPEPLPERSAKIDIPYLEGAVHTRQLIDKAILQGEFEIEDAESPKLQWLQKRGSRYAERAKKWALAIAVDLGLSYIDNECLNRGCDIVEYEILVKAYLNPFDANNVEAKLQMKIRSALENSGGQMDLRKLKRVCHADREGVSTWERAFNNLCRVQTIKMIGQGVKGDPRIVQVLRKRDE